MNRDPAKTEVRVRTTSQSREDAMINYLLSVSHGRRGLAPTLMRTMLGALAPIYCAGLRIYLLPYDIGLRQRVHLPCRVISVGNLTTGGTGKTPMTQRLCRLLAAQGHRVAVLSRGYGGRLEHGCGIVSDGMEVLLSADVAGDEAYLLAHTLPGIPVLVGKDRRVSGRLAVERFQPDVIVLDDGLQYWHLYRDLDIVLLNACDPFDNGWTFPRGLLREPPSQLRRAGIVVLTNCHGVGSQTLGALIARVRRLAPGKPIYTADLAPIGLKNVRTGAPYESLWLVGRRVTALSAIGNPASFEAKITELGGVIVDRCRLRDHRGISASDLARIGRASAAAGAEAIVTTEKDAVKLPGVELELPIAVLQVEMRLEVEAEFVASISELWSKSEWMSR